MRSVVRLLVASLCLAVAGPSGSPSSVAAKGFSVEQLKSPRVVERTFRSNALSERRRYVVYFPPGYSADTSRRYPVVYLLHGLGGRGANWFDPARGAIAQQLDALIGANVIPPVIAVAPDGGSGYWTDHVGKPSRRFGAFVSHDLVQHVDAHTRTRPSRAYRAVAGVSMGGHGAMSIVLMNPDRFQSAASVAGALFPNAPTHRKVYHRVWGKPPNEAHWHKTSPIRLMGKLRPHGPTTPRLYLSCGTRDGLGFADYAKAASEALNKQGVPHRLRLVPGGRHSWAMFGPDAAHWLPWITAPWKSSAAPSATPPP